MAQPRRGDTYNGIDNKSGGCEGIYHHRPIRFSSAYSLKPWLQEQSPHKWATPFPPEDYRLGSRGAGEQGSRGAEMTSVILHHRRE
ncbi:hypothetical protein [Brasilonema bromeliae]|uniref:hypothetical protein n=1 Tax=Brasilonema bromeliae TaxID=383615 RepID=UPI00145D241D|nr:hypothetical protein [Brasilonema bromeliae]